MKNTIQGGFCVACPMQNKVKGGIGDHFEFKTKKEFYSNIFENSREDPDHSNPSGGPDHVLFILTYVCQMVDIKVRTRSLLHACDVTFALITKSTSCCFSIWPAYPYSITCRHILTKTDHIFNVSYVTTAACVKEVMNYLIKIRCMLL